LSLAGTTLGPRVRWGKKASALLLTPPPIMNRSGENSASR